MIDNVGCSPTDLATKLHTSALLDNFSQLYDCLQREPSLLYTNCNWTHFSLHVNSKRLCYKKNRHFFICNFNGRENCTVLDGKYLKFGKKRI